MPVRSRRLPRAGFCVVDTSVHARRAAGARSRACRRTADVWRCARRRPDDRDAVARRRGARPACVALSPRSAIDPDAVADRIKRDVGRQLLRTAARRRLVVAERDGGGRPASCRCWSTRRRGDIDLIAVEPGAARAAARGRRWSTRWLDRDRRARERRCVGTQASNVASLRLYERLGFRLSQRAVRAASHVRGVARREARHEDRRPSTRASACCSSPRSATTTRATSTSRESWSSRGRAAGADAVKFQTFVPEQSRQRPTRRRGSRSCGASQLRRRAVRRGWPPRPRARGRAVPVDAVRPRQRRLARAAGAGVQDRLRRQRLLPAARARRADRQAASWSRSGIGRPRRAPRDLRRVRRARPGAARRRGGELALLHCVSAYPTPRRGANLRAIRSLRGARA